MAPLGAGEFAGALEAQETFVQQNRGVQQRVSAAVAKLSARLAAQVFVGDCEQPLPCGFVTRMRALDKE